ncbi:MAG: hypothetical protein WBF71_01065 [Microthrixaceae bacterium]
MTESRPHVPERARDLVAIAAIAVMIGLAVPGLLRYQGPPMEEGFMLAFPEQILKGNLPHKDFLHLYGPGSLWLLAGVYKVLGVSLTVERLVGLIQHAAVAYGMFALLRPFGRRVATPAAMVSVLILIGPLGLSAMAWNGALAFAICGLALGAAAVHATGTRARNLAIGAGILAGLSLLFRPDLIIAVGLGFGAVWFRLPRGRRWSLLWGLIGSLSLYIPHVLLSGIGNSFRGMFLDPVFKLRGGRSLPVPPSWNEVDGFLQRAGGLRTTGWPLPMLAIPHQINLWFWMVPISIAVVVIGAWRLRRRSPGSRRTSALWPAALFCLALITQAVQRPDTAHLAWVTGVSFPLLIPAMLVLAEERLPKRSDLQRLAMSLGVVVVVLVGVIPFYPVRTYLDLVGQSFGFNRFGYVIERDGRKFYFGDSDGARAAQQVTDRLGELMKPGQSLIVGPTDLSRTNYSDSFFYYLFPDLDAGTRYIEMDPGIADAPDSGLSGELRHNDWLILSDAWSGWTEPNDSAHARSTEPNEVVRAHYCMVEDAGMFKLLERCR